MFCWYCVEGVGVKGNQRDISNYVQTKQFLCCIVWRESMIRILIIDDTSHAHMQDSLINLCAKYKRQFHSSFSLLFARRISVLEHRSQAHQQFKWSQLDLDTDPISTVHTQNQWIIYHLIRFDVKWQTIFCQCNQIVVHNKFHSSHFHSLEKQQKLISLSSRSRNSLIKLFQICYARMFAHNKFAQRTRKDMGKLKNVGPFHDERHSMLALERGFGWISRMTEQSLHRKCMLYVHKHNLL